MIVHVEPDWCVSSGTCAAHASAYFAQRSDDGKVVLLKPAVAPGDEPLIEDVADMCPAQAILTSAGPE